MVLKWSVASGNGFLVILWRDIWHGRVVVRALDLDQLGCPTFSLHVIYTHVPLSPNNGWWCSAAGKVTAGLASH